MRSDAARWLAKAACLMLAGCAAGPGQSDANSVTKPSDQWDAIAPAEADLTLPLVAPLKIKSIKRIVRDGKEYKDIYTFDGVDGYVVTSRMHGGSYPERYATLFQIPYDSAAYIASLSLPSAPKIVARYPRSFLNGKFLDQKSLSHGFTAEGSAPPRYDHCFVARTAYLLVDFDAVEHSDHPIDTVVEALLCGNLPRHTSLVQMLMRVEAVEDRKAFRDALAQRNASAS